MIETMTETMTETTLPISDAATPDAFATVEPALREFLDTFAPETATEAFTPDSADKADWVIGKMADARARAARIRENAEKMARACEAEVEALEWRFGPALQAFARKELEGGKRKSVRLFNGVIGFRTKPAGVTITDPTSAGKWAREFCLDAIISRLDAKRLAAALMETGEVADFAHFTPAEEVFYVK